MPNYAARALAPATNVLQVAGCPINMARHRRCRSQRLRAGRTTCPVLRVHAGWQLRTDSAPFDVDGVIILGGQDPATDAATRRAPVSDGSHPDESEQDSMALTVAGGHRGAVPGRRAPARAQGLTDVIHIAWSHWRTRRCAGSAAGVRKAYDIEPVVLQPDLGLPRDGYDVMRAAPIAAGDSGERPAAFGDALYLRTCSGSRAMRSSRRHPTALTPTRPPRRSTSP